jgi:hypothetical protein
MTADFCKMVSMTYLIVSDRTCVDDHVVARKWTGDELNIQLLFSGRCVGCAESVKKNYKN